MGHLVLDGMKDGMILGIFLASKNPNPTPMNRFAYLSGPSSDQSFIACIVFLKFKTSLYENSLSFNTTLEHHLCCALIRMDFYIGSIFALSIHHHLPYGTFVKTFGNNVMKILFVTVILLTSLALRMVTKHSSFFFFFFNLILATNAICYSISFS